MSESITKKAKNEVMSVLKFNILDSEISFKENYVICGYIMDKIGDFHSEKIKSFDKYHNSKRNLDSFLEGLPDFLNEIIVQSFVLMKEMINYFYDFSDIEVSQLYKKYYSGFEYADKLRPIISAYEDICNYETQVNNYHDYKKSVQSGGRWIGGGFGLNGAIKGALTAGALNAGASVFRGIGNAVSRGKDLAAVDSAKRALYKNDNTVEIIKDIIYSFCNATVNYTEDFLAENTKYEIVFFNREYAEQLLNYLKSIDDIDIIKSKIPQCIQKDPYNWEYYSFIVDKFGDIDDDAGKVSETFLYYNAVESRKRSLKKSVDDLLSEGRLEECRNIFNGNKYVEDLLNNWDFSQYDNKIITLYNEGSYSECIKFYEFGVISKNPEVLKALGYCYDDKPFVAKNEQKALNLFIRGAELGDEICAFEAACLFENGDKSIKNIEKAVEFYNIAAQKGYSSAMTSLGMMYMEGNGMEPDYEKGLYWLNNATEAGNGDAMNSLGYLYSGGIGVEQDIENAITWFQKAYENNSVIAARNLGVIYADGINGSHKDADKALYWYEKAVEGGKEKCKSNITQLCTSVGNNYMEGNDGYPQNYQKALKWYKKGSEYNSPDCQAMIGLMYGRGLGIAIDYNECAKYLMLAKNNPESSDYIKSICRDKLENLKYDGEKWTKRWFLSI